MNKSLGVLVTLFSILLFANGCKEDSELALNNRLRLIGSWNLNYSVMSINTNGELVWDVSEPNNRLTLLENGQMIEDRNFVVDTSTWFFSPEPPTLIFGDYFPPNEFGSPGIIARTLPVVSLEENRVVLEDQLEVVNSSGSQISVIERWELTR